jgi:4-amino-4-deoxy-L-arabinose transferase-like glycosyltransferase
MEFLHNIDWKKYGWVTLLVIIFAIGVWLRLTHYGELLIIKSDQARDALIIKNVTAVGFQSLPLLGPQVGGTYFRLGPIFYYFQYFSGQIFGGTTESFSYPDLIFGILTLPLLFLLLRRFFILSLSLWLTALASVSIFLVTFSRFGWNPNSLPFFATTFALSFLIALEQTGWKRRGFLILAAVSMGVIAQLHLVAILGLGLGLVLFLIFFKPLKWQELALCGMIVLAFQLPVLIYEQQNNGANIRAFFRAADNKGSQNTNHSWYEKSFRAYQEDADVMWLILTGYENTALVTTKSLSIKCDDKCVSALPFSAAAMLLFGYILAANYCVWRSIKDAVKKRAFAFIGLWIGGFLILTIPLAYQLETRFFLSIIPLLFILIGFTVIHTVNRYPISQTKIILASIGTMAILINFQVSTRYLHELSTSITSADESNRDLRFGTAPKVTLGQLRAIAREASAHFAPGETVIITGESLYAKAMYYVLSVEFGYPGCYIRGDKTVSDHFNNHLIIEYTPSAKTSTPFGTLSAGFEARSSSQTAAPLPKNCLTY